MPFPGGFPEPEEILAGIITFVIGITIHEFTHAWTASALGDQTARGDGRISLNPVRHFDPLGYFFGLFLIFGLSLFAFGKAVPVNYRRLSGGRRSLALVALAGPLSNLVLAALVPVVLMAGGSILLGPGGATGSPIGNLVKAMTDAMLYINLLLFALNLIPIPPFDGFDILIGIGPDHWAPRLEAVRPYALLILFLLIFFPVLGVIVIPIMGAVLAVLQPVQRSLVQLLVPG